MDVLTQSGSRGWQVTLLVYINHGMDNMVSRRAVYVPQVVVTCGGSGVGPPGFKSSYVTLGCLPNLSVPWFPHLKLGDGNTSS